MHEQWQGTFTALVTPFQSDGTIDEESLRNLVDFQVDGGVDGIVPCGTTGEAATMSIEEHSEVVRIVIEKVDGRVPVIAGAGGNATDKVVALAKGMESLGADAVLSVVPYYNKPTQDGMYQHFSEVADGVSVPVILYNVPSRTGGNMLPETVLRLARHGNIRGIKEASGNLGQVMEIIRQRPDGFRVLSGEDDLTYTILALGGDGVISVVSNEVPMMMSSMVRVALSGGWSEARELHYKLLDLMHANFIETNPIPVKAALSMMGLIQENYRLPLVPMKESNREKLRGYLAKMDLAPEGKK
jgi:4-hydroxy-tetrahydrodipicolinate synthase